MKTSDNTDGRSLDEAGAKQEHIMKLRYIDSKDKERSVWIQVDDSGEVWIEPHLFIHEIAMLCSGEPITFFGKRKHPLMRASWLRTQAAA